MYIKIFTLFIRYVHVVIDEEKHKWAEAFITIDKIKKWQLENKFNVV